MKEESKIKPGKNIKINFTGFMLSTTNTDSPKRFISAVVPPIKRPHKKTIGVYGTYQIYQQKSEKKITPIFGTKYLKRTPMKRLRIMYKMTKDPSSAM